MNCKSNCRRVQEKYFQNFIKKNLVIESRNYLEILNKLLKKKESDLLRKDFESRKNTKQKKFEFLKWLKREHSI